MGMVWARVEGMVWDKILIRVGFRVEKFRW